VTTETLVLTVAAWVVMFLALTATFFALFVKAKLARPGVPAAVFAVVVSTLLIAVAVSFL
jgi:hypothetical protein